MRSTELRILVDTPFIVVVLFLMFGIQMNGVSQDLPKEMEHLRELASFPDELVEEAYQYHRTQVKSISDELDSLRRNRVALTNLKKAQLQEQANNIEKIWQFVLTKNPENARAHNYYGELLFDFLANQTDGLQHWIRASQLDPNYASPQNNLGLAMFHSGNYKKGYEHLKKALDSDPKHSDYLFNMAQMYMTHFPQLGDILGKTKSQMYKDAMKMSEKAAKYAPDEYEVVYDYANNFFAADRFDVKISWTTAAKAWQKVIPLSKSKDELFNAHLNQGRTWLKANQGTKARSAFKEALNIDPDSRVANQLYNQVE